MKIDQENVLIYNYLGVDLSIVWKVVEFLFYTSTNYSKPLMLSLGRPSLQAYP